MTERWVEHRMRLLYYRQGTHSIALRQLRNGLPSEMGMVLLKFGVCTYKYN